MALPQSEIHKAGKVPRQASLAEAKLPQAGELLAGDPPQQGIPPAAAPVFAHDQKTAHGNDMYGEPRPAPRPRKKKGNPDFESLELRRPL